jgi:hypothetical protein
VTPFLAIGLEVTFAEDSDGERYSTGQSDRRELLWRGVNGGDPSAESGAIVHVGIAQGVTRRTVIHPAPKSSALWGTAGVGEPLVLCRDLSQIGTAAVAWIHDLDRGIERAQLRAMVDWSAGGPMPLPTG